jgi:hypothetical protein
MAGRNASSEFGTSRRRKLSAAAQGACRFWARRVQGDQRVFKNRDSPDGPWPHAVTLPELRCACSRPTPLERRPAKAGTTNARANKGEIPFVLCGYKAR